MQIGLRYAGEGAEIVLIDSTTQQQLMASLALETCSFGFPFELTTKQFMGDTGPTYREFSNGWEAEVKFEPSDAAEVVEYVNLIKAKAEGKISDEFALQMLFKCPDGPTLQVILSDAHWEGLPFDLGGRTEFLTATHKLKGKEYKIRII